MSPSKPPNKTLIKYVNIKIGPFVLVHIISSTDAYICSDSSLFSVVTEWLNRLSTIVTQKNT